MTDKNYYIKEETLALFFQECREKMQEMEGVLLDFEKGNISDELINQLFRAAHTIKGSSGMFGFTHIEHFTHRVENLLDKLRKGELKIDSELINLLLACKDHLEEFFDTAETLGDILPDGELRQTDMKLISSIELYIPEARPAKAVENIIESEEHSTDGDRVASKYWHISLRPGINVFKNGLDPYSFVCYLKNLGSIAGIATIKDSIPPLDELDPENCYVGFEIDFLGDVTKEKLEEVFEFIKDESRIRILPPGSLISDYLNLIKELPEKTYRIGEILNEIGSLTGKELNDALELQNSADAGDGTEKSMLGDIIVDEHMTHKPIVEAALEKQESIRKKQNSMRIDAEKLDRLINLVGELVINGANIKQISECEIINRPGLITAISSMTRLIEDIRDSTMSIRMVPVGETFKRFERIVRDLGRERGKEIDLVITGGDTELDKTLIEKISDPLMHLVRNSIDHGIGTPEERIKNGKSGRGKIVLNAFHETGNIVIEVIDDGEGLNSEKIFRKAVERGLVDAGANIPEHELYQFIFNAGFSTAAEVTNLSGRGVGMDVVKRNIESLRGSVLLNSEQGRGTTVNIHLPLTLSIIDGFMFMIGGSYYVVPLDKVIECMESSSEQLNSNEGGNYINLRGKLLPFVRPRDFFSEESPEPDITNVIIVRHKGGSAGLVVDRLVGELQTVIKPLGDVFQGLKWISGSTILGTGEVAFILDVANLIDGIRESEKLLH